jgi:CO dehydrogenase maturation factor
VSLGYAESGRIGHQGLHGAPEVTGQPVSLIGPEVSPAEIARDYHRNMKIAVTGKGGVGKTTLTALLAQVYAERGHEVLAVDADPSPCLAGALGFPADLRAKLRPISGMDALIEERTGAKPGTTGGFFTLNPRVDDIPERFSVVHRGVRLLEMGSVDVGGSGCICPESAMLKTLFANLLLRKQDVLLLDMYAGVEHLGRATVDFVDGMIIVVEPTRRSLGTAAQIMKLAADIGLRRLFIVGNKIRNDQEVRFLQDETQGLPVLGFLPADLGVQEADRLGVAVFDHVPALRESAEQIVTSMPVPA